MLEPKQLGLRRLWLATGHPWYMCRDMVWPPDDYKPLSPSSFSAATCTGNPFVYWTMDRPGSITALTAFVEFEAAIGEHVRIRARYTNGGVPAMTSAIRIESGEHSSWVHWNPGAYIFQAGDLLLIEHVSWTNVSTYAENLECIVEVSLDG